MNIIFLGIQGAGKSTQGNLLSEQLKIPYLSTGHIFRAKAHEKSPEGRMIKELINAGSLVPDGLTVSVVNEYLSKPEYSTGFVLDGYPRTLQQAKACTFPITKVIMMELDEKEALWRLVMRKQMRDDNTIQAVQHRIRQFHEHIDPVLSYFQDQNKLVTIDAKLPIKTANEQILQSLGKKYVENRLLAWEQKAHKIVAFVGLAGSGKTKSVTYLADKYQLPVVSFSNVINEYIDKNGLPHTQKIHTQLRQDFRKEYGMEAMAVLKKNEVAEAVKHNKITLIEGLYSWEEYVFLRKSFPNAQVILVALWARKDLRWSRAAKRTYRNGLHGEERDIGELLDTHKGPPIAYADYLVVNDYSVAALHERLDETYRAILYS